MNPSTSASTLQWFDGQGNEIGIAHEGALGFKHGAAFNKNLALMVRFDATTGELSSGNVVWFESLDCSGHVRIFRGRLRSQLGQSPDLARVVD